MVGAVRERPVAAQPRSAAFRTFEEIASGDAVRAGASRSAPTERLRQSQMFTGIIEELGAVEAVREDGLSVRATQVLEDARLGDSICINGVCLTVTSIADGVFSVDTVPETRRRTNLGELAPGDPVNLERALRPNDRMGGHFVQGHVEGTGTVESVTQDGPALMIRFSAPAELLRY